MAHSKVARGAGILALAAALFGAGPALAGTCPTQHVLAQPRQIRDAPDVGVSREILSTVNLRGWHGLGDFHLRTRRLIVAPRGIVPTHQHDDRPSIVYVVSGEIWEHSAFCAVPIRHRAGEWTPEFGPGHAHWWENRTRQRVVLTSSDIIPVEMMNDPHM
jgi:quercetin dioxygenase-like cupin family protein